MSEYTCISKKQYRILLSFALMLIFTTSSLPGFVGACAQNLVFMLISLVLFQKIENKRICWGLFLFLSAVMSELALFLSEFAPTIFPESGFFLLPVSTFLFLSAPMFGCFDEEHSVSFAEFGSGFLYYVVCGLIIAPIREICGSATIFGRSIRFFSRLKVPFLGHTAGGALLVLLSLILLPKLFGTSAENGYRLQTEEGKARKYSSIQLQKEKNFVYLCLCLLIYDLVFGAIGAVVIKFAPASLLKPAHVVAFASVTSLALFTLIVGLFKQTQTLDQYRYIPLLGIITTSLPMIFYMNYIQNGEHGLTTTNIIWWIGLMIGVWVTSVVVVSYTRVVKDRLLFGKQPRSLEGMPFIILHVMLAIIVLMPWTSVLPSI